MKSSTKITVLFVLAISSAVGCASPRTNIQAANAYTATDVAPSSFETAPLAGRESHADQRPAERAPHR
jgi:hypothetical protein